ncbi:MAG: hypothetical protein GX410_01530 [Elusimicrobia bacterium]|nr:hypothetical protein [Elusimicrobiota bacterium]
MEKQPDIKPEFTLPEVMIALRRSWLLLLAPVVICVLGAMVYVRATDQWRAKVSLRLAAVSGVSGFESKKLVADSLRAKAGEYSRLMGLQGRDASRFVRSISLTYGDKSDIVTLSVTMPSREGAVQTVEFVARDIIARHTAQHQEVLAHIQAEIAQVQSRAAELQKMLDGLYLGKAARSGDSISVLAESYLSAQLRSSLLGELNALRERVIQLETSLLSINNHSTEQVGDIGAGRSANAASIVVFSALAGLCVGLFLVLRGGLV